MAEKKNHHFVPQSYQRLFSNDGKGIGVYNIKKNLLINQSSIKNTMSKNYFYSKNQNVEDALAEIERLCMLAFHKMDKYVLEISLYHNFFVTLCVISINT